MIFLSQCGKEKKERATAQLYPVTVPLCGEASVSQSPVFKLTSSLFSYLFFFAPKKSYKNVFIVILCPFHH